MSGASVTVHVARPPKYSEWGLPAAVIGAIIVIAGIFADGQLGWGGLLVGATFGIQIALGASFLCAVNLVTGARWWRPVADVQAWVAQLIVVPSIFIVIVVFLGSWDLYEWADPEAAEHNHFIHLKHAWLNVPFFFARTLLYVAIWIGLITLLTRKILALHGKPRSAGWGRLGGFAAAYIIIYALTQSAAWWDWLMSIEVIWFNTMQGVYGFAGSFVAGIAAVTIASVYRSGRGDMTLKENELHDLGKYLFAFQFFWAYIWFCQFMLTWYANIPEEVIYYQSRINGGWELLFMLNPIINFALPFFILMSQRTKKRPELVACMAWLALFGRAFDLWLCVGPSFDPTPHTPLLPIAGVLTVGGTMAWWYGRQRRAALKV